jgi:hypothetical protein
MQNEAPTKYDAKISINCSEIKKHCTVQLDSSWGMHIKIPEKAGIQIYAFNKMMLSNYVTSALPREENYSLIGPRLGLYHDTKDPREGPYINHWIEQLKIQIKYDVTGKHFLVNGEANLSNSGVDEYWYNGERSGTWQFHLEFSIPQTD